MLHNSNCITAILKPRLCLNLPLLFFVLQLYGCKLIFNACCIELKCNEALLLYQKMEGFSELHNNTVPKKHDSQNNTPLNITPLTHVSDGLYIEYPPELPICYKITVRSNI
jgi:hypothetical protein